nr:hypothetical protein CFP56_64692 [Quercus suber]
MSKAARVLYVLGALPIVLFVVACGMLAIGSVLRFIESVDSRGPTPVLHYVSVSAARRREGQISKLSVIPSADFPSDLAIFSFTTYSGALAFVLSFDTRDSQVLLNHDREYDTKTLYLLPSSGHNEPSIYGIHLNRRAFRRHDAVRAVSRMPPNFPKASSSLLVWWMRAIISRSFIATPLDIIPYASGIRSSAMRCRKNGTVVPISESGPDSLFRIACPSLAHSIP